MSAFDLSTVEDPVRFDVIARIMGFRTRFVLDLRAGWNLMGEYHMQELKEFMQKQIRRGCRGLDQMCQLYRQQAEENRLYLHEWSPNTSRRSELDKLPGALFFFKVLFTDEISVNRKGTDQNTRMKENAGKHKQHEVDGAVAGDDSQLGRCKAMEETVSVRGRRQRSRSASCGCVSGSEMFEDADDRRRKLEYGWGVCVWANLRSAV